MVAAIPVYGHLFAFVLGCSSSFGWLSLCGQSSLLFGWSWQEGGCGWHWHWALCHGCCGWHHSVVVVVAGDVVVGEEM